MPALPSPGWIKTAYWMTSTRRSVINGFLKAGMKSLTAVQTAQPPDRSSHKNKLAAWRHLCRFYEQKEQQTGEGR